MPQRWALRSDRPANPAAAAWAGQLGVSERLVGLLWDRGLDSLAAMDVSSASYNSRFLDCASSSYMTTVGFKPYFVPASALTAR